MNLTIRLLKKDEFIFYSEYLNKFEYASLFSSIKYFKLLKAYLKDQFYILGAFNEADDIIGVLPFFIKCTAVGSVLNSLPFYGSNGSVLSDSNEAKSLLLEELNFFAIKEKCISATIITCPLDKESYIYKNIYDYNYSDERIGQLTSLKDINSKEELMDVFHFKTRNTIRKGFKSNVVIDWQCGLEYFDFLKKTHFDNLSLIGGIPKPDLFFDVLRDNFQYGSDYRIYYCLLDGKPIAALLLLYSNKTVEYFTPVVVAEYRNLQVLSSIIYSAMIDCLGKYDWWNWGGTWVSQDGVYQFKSRWGTSDFNYYYYTKIFDKAIITLPKEFFLKNFPNYYVLPFNVLDNDQ